MKTRDFGKKSIFWILYKYFSSKGTAATLLFRISNFFYRKNMKVMAHIVHNHSIKVTGCDINEGAIIGNGLDIRHPVGIVIGGAVEIGNNFSILSTCTLGAIDKNRGGGKIIIGNNVYIGSGAKLIGNFSVGDNVFVGANAVVLRDVPSNVTVVGVPARVVVKKDTGQENE